MHEWLHIFGKLPHKGQVKLTLGLRLHKRHGHEKKQILHHFLNNKRTTFVLQMERRLVKFFRGLSE